MKDINKLTIVISSPSSYRDVFEINSQLFDKYWADCIYRKIYSTDFLENQINTSFEILTSNQNDDWISRMRLHLHNVNTKYVFLITDDLFLKSKIENSQIEELIKFMDANDIIYTRLYKNSIFKRKKNYIQKNIYQMKYCQPYAKNLLGGIWERKYLLKVLNKDLSAYEIEMQWNKESIEFGNENINHHIYYHNDYFFHSVYKGKWVRGAKYFFKKNKLLFISKRGTVSRVDGILIWVKMSLNKFVTPKTRAKLKSWFGNIIQFDSKY